MSTLAQTISRALQSVGPAAEDRMRDILAEFDNLNLSGEERLAAVATTIAATAFTLPRPLRPTYPEPARPGSSEFPASPNPPPLRRRWRADPSASPTAP